MADFQDKLEQQAYLLFKSVEGWNTNALKRIGRRVKKIGSLSRADLQAINNATIVEQDINAIISELADLTEQSAPEVVRIYADALKDQHLENKPLYDYRNKPFIPFSDNKELQAIVKAYARTTMGTMVGLSMTKSIALGTVNKLGKFTPLEKSFKDVLDKAVIAVTTGTGDFNSEMRDAIRELGGSGMRIDYGGGITRRVESMVRQNVLWGAKQASIEYNEMIGEELGCDGIEIDWHSNPRPSHEFMQGKQFSLNGKRTINGITYEDASPALDALRDYGCLHYKTPIVLGVSEPRYTPEELKRLNEENTRQIAIDGVTKTGYQWKQTMRQFEREARYTKEKIELFNASGDKSEVKRLRQHLNGVEERYYKIADGSGIKAQPGRMAYTKGVSKVVDNSGKSGIIRDDISISKINNLLRIPQVSSSIITRKIDLGEYSTTLSVQQYKKHKKGTPQYNAYLSSRQDKGANPQSVILISEDEAKQIILQKAGTGIVKTDRKGNPKPQEKITCDKIIGKYFGNGQYHNTNKATIHYGKKYSHIVPIKGDDYD